MVIRLSARQHALAGRRADRDFYVTLLGLEVGPRPPFASTGYWLYAGGQPVLHLVQRGVEEPVAEGSGNLDHIGFAADNLPRVRAALAGGGVPFEERTVPRDGTVQIFVRDPDGIRVELNFA